MTRDQHKSRQALLIIGMHRSGTSALTRIINLHGVPLGSELPEAAFDNEAGFWENQRVVNLHERLLAELGSSWDDPRELREGWLDEVMATAYLDELVGLIAAEFGDARIWAVKDPRLCRLLPLWLKALARLDIEPKLIFALRHPGEVVGSLMLRNGLSAATASMLWLRHLAEPVQASRNLLRCAVDYDELLLDWRSCMARIKSDLAVEWPVPSQVCAPEAEAHLRRDLRHQNASTAQDLLPAAWRHLLLDVHASGLAVARGEAGWENLDTKLQVLIAQFEFARPLMADLLPKSGQDCLQVRLDQAEHDRAVYRTEAERLFGECVSAQVVLQESEIARQESEVARQELRGEIAKLQARLRIMEQVRNELELIKSSRSWRWTRPLRFASRTIHQRGLDEQDQRRIAQLLGRKKGASGSATLNPLSSTDEGTDASVMPQLAPPSVGLRDFFVWAVIDWHFRIQRPQHISRELALAGHRVFYISNNFVDRSEPGFNVESLDSEGRLFQIHLHLRGSPMIYHATPDAATRSQLRAGIGMLLAWTRGGACASLIQHPYWLETAQVLPNQRIVYDCMDHHGGFADNSDEVLEREHELMRDADLLVVTSDWLNNETGKYNPRRMMIRNACQYEHFATRPERIFKDGQGRRVIGYYGAIAEWFDLELLEKVARRFSDCLVLLVGADTSGAQQRLQALDNVEFTGEVPYASLPYYLEGFDVCLLPFQVIPLTLATNPVKVYEYLSAGKDVVSIELPEIRQFGNLVRTGTDHGSFLDAVAAALAAIPDPAVIAQRKQFAAEQTWAHRVQDLVQGIEALPEPRVSVVVVTYNNLELTKACLYSLEQYSDYANLEVIVVDNASADGTPAYLKEWAAAGRDRRIIMNSDNRGFAAANNQGLALASGDYLVMLNNDTYVTPGWIATLVGHLRRSENLGMLGPVTNNIGNEARIEIRYDNMDEMLQVAAAYTSHHAGQLTPLRTAAFFCVMLRRSVYEKVGSLDEAFGIGFFEDDDYCRRVEQAGWTIACADDVFVHHNLSASFNKLKQETRQALFEQNKAAYEAKWGKWVPHKYRGA